MIIRELSIDEIKQTYKEHLKADFPADELKPLGVILRSYRRGDYLCIGAYDGGEMAGYAFFVFDDRTCLLDYYAVVRGRRGQGLGTEFLSRLGTSAIRSRCDIMLIEVEDPLHSPVKDSTVRLKRLEFYLKCGAVRTGAQASVFGVDYILLEFPLNGEPHTREEAADAYGKLYASQLPKLLFKHQILIRT